MKKLLTLIGCLIYMFSSGQTIDPSKGTTSNKSYSPAQAVPTDYRSYFNDLTNFTVRPYQSTSEVLTYLNLSKYRTGQFPIVVNSGGTLTNGLISGGVNTLYYFKNGTADSNLVVMIPTSSSGPCGGCLLSQNNLGDVASVSGARANLGLTDMATATTTAAGDLTGTWPNIVVAKFNGQLPAYYLNYNNLFNQPTIPAQVNLIAGAGISITGSYPNLTITASAGAVGFTTAGIDLIALSSSTVALDTLHYRKVDSMYTTNDSTLIYILNGQSHSLSIRGGVPGTGGGGLGTVISVSGVNANGVSWSITNPTSNVGITISLGAITPSTVNGLTLTALATGFTIQGGTTSKTLTVPLDATVSGTNTGDVTLAGETYITRSGQVLTANPVNVSGTNITGVLKSSAFPAQTGDVTNSAGSLVTTISANVVTNAKLAQMGAFTVKGNNTSGTANAADLTQAQFTALVNTFTTSLNGSVPAPGSISGKVLGDNGAWVVNGTGNPNSKIGTGYWLVNGSDNTVKTLGLGFGIKMDSLTSGVITITVDTNLIAARGIDSIFVTNAGPANSATVFSLGYTNGTNTIFLKKVIAGANIAFTQNNDSSWIISAGGTSGGITNVGIINSATPSSNGVVISGNTLTEQFATPQFPGLIKATGAQSIGATLTFTVPITISTMTSNGGTIYANGSGTFTQGSAGLATQVWHGGPSPTMSAVNLATDVTGVTQLINGGNGVTNPVINAGTNISITGTWGSYTISTVGIGTVTSVAASGGSTGLIFTVTNPTTAASIAVSGTLLPIAGGTGLASYSPFAPVVGGSTATGPLQQVAGGGGTAGFVLTSTGVNSLPVWAASTTQSLASTQIAYGDPSNNITSKSNFNFDATNNTVNIVTGTTINTVFTAFTAQNPQPSTVSGNNEYGGAFASNGSGSRASSINSKLRWYNKAGDNGGINPHGQAVWEFSTNSGPYNEVMRVNDIGTMIISNGTSATSNALGTLSLSSITASQSILAGLMATSGSMAVGQNFGTNIGVNRTNILATDQAVWFSSNSLSSTTLPASSGGLLLSGQIITVSVLQSNTLTVNAGVGDVILNQSSVGVSSISLLQGQWATFQYQNATGWIIMATNSFGAGGTQTLDQVLAAGSTLTANRNINDGGHQLEFSGNPVWMANGVQAQGLAVGSAIQTGNATPAANVACHLSIDATGGNRTVVLPLGYGLINGSAIGSVFAIKKVDATTNTVTISVTGGGTIDGASTYVLNTQNQAVMLVAGDHTLTNWSDYLVIGTASVSGAVTSGTYTPTVVGGSNVASSTTHVAQYIRVGNIVNVTGTVSITQTASNGSTTVTISLPITSSFSATTDAQGVTTSTTPSPGGPPVAGSIVANNSSSVVNHLTRAADTNSNLYTYSFSYIVH